MMLACAVLFDISCKVHDVSEDSCDEMHYHADKIAPSLFMHNFVRTFGGGKLQMLAF